MIAQEFTPQKPGPKIEIHIDEASSGGTKQFRIIARYEGGGLANGFEIRCDNIAGLPLEEAVKHPTIQQLIYMASMLADTDHWERFEQLATTPS